MRLNRHRMSKAQRRKIREQIAEILRSRGEILFAIVHGSFQTGLAFEDIDIAVHLKDAFQEAERFEKESELSLDMEKQLRMPVDVHILNGSTLGFQYAVTSGELLFARDGSAFYDFRERVWLRYLDHRYFYEQSLQDLLASVFGPGGA